MIHFLSDLHLSSATPDISRLFLAYLAGPARCAGRVFILGDLFEAWPGDDALDDPADDSAQHAAEALRALSDSGTSIAIQHGNRDFLLGAEFVRRAGARLLPDPFVLDLPTRSFVLSHGDLLCTDDAEYQAFRAQVRQPYWSEVFLRRPLAERQIIATAMRQQSEASKHEKSQQAMDVNLAATDDFLREHRYATLIHGHTHRPDRHVHHVDGVAVERWVLADWHATRGEYLAWDGETLSRHALLPQAPAAAAGTPASP